LVGDIANTTYQRQGHLVPIQALGFVGLELSASSESVAQKKRS
jgi:hypothetical protein